MGQRSYDVAVRVKGNVDPGTTEQFIKGVAELAKTLDMEAGFEIEPIDDDAEKSYAKIVVNTWRAGVPGSKILTFHNITKYKQVGNKIEFWYPKRKKNGDTVLTHVVCYGECYLKTEEGLILVKGKRSVGMSASAVSWG
jgi:hypothetical protein